jgi:CDP-glycerol glycerophosphotransferase (TagB/SpsB family)
VAQCHLSRGDKVPAIRAADLVVVGDMSSIIPEIMMLERPMVALPWRLEAVTGIPYPYTPEDGLVVVEDLGQLPEVVQTLLDDPQRRQEMVHRQNEALPDLNCGYDGLALTRLTREVLNLAWKSRERQPSFPCAAQATPFLQ